VMDHVMWLVKLRGTSGEAFIALFQV
jgi:hypothetical protein